MLIDCDVRLGRLQRLQGGVRFPTGGRCSSESDHKPASAFGTLPKGQQIRSDAGADGPRSFPHGDLRTVRMKEDGNMRALKGAHVPCALEAFFAFTVAGNVSCI
jgi:hypothetical protein